MIGTSKCEAIAYDPGQDHNQTIFVIDTPGFDDTSRPEIEILREIAGALLVLTKLKVDLYGIIYLHRITDPRVSGAAMRSLRVLEMICGEEAYKNVFLVTTMWDRLKNIEGGNKIGEDREVDLCEKPFWGDLRENGALTMGLGRPSKLWNLKELNAKEIVRRLVKFRKPIPLLIQTQMEQSGGILDLGNTSAGSYLEENMDALKKRHEKDLAALRKELDDAENDEETKDLLARDLERNIEETERIGDQLRELLSFKSDGQSIRNSSSGVTPANVPPLPPRGATTRPARKAIPVTASAVTVSSLNDEFTALREKYKSSLSERGRRPSKASDLQFPSNIRQAPGQATSTSQESDDNDTQENPKIPVESGQTADSNQTAVNNQTAANNQTSTNDQAVAGNRQSPKVASEDVQFADASQSGTPLGSKSPQSEAGTQGTGRSNTFGIPQGAVGKVLKKILLEAGGKRLTKEKSSTSRRPDDMAVSAAKSAVNTAEANKLKVEIGIGDKQ